MKYPDAWNQANSTDQAAITDEELAARRTSGKVRLPTSPKEQMTSD
jgi:hypothetical protein